MTAALEEVSALQFPLVTAEITVEVGETEISFGPTATRLRGQISGLIAAHCANGLAFG